MTIDRNALCGAFAVLLAAAGPSMAGEIFSAIDAGARKQFWLDTGFATWHFDSDKGLNGRNPGVGMEYHFSNRSALTAGRFYNSDRRHSHYAGLMFQPYAIGPVRLGAVLAAFNGYPKMREGGWFPALVPAASIEYQRVGINLAFVPGYKDRLHGGISLQLKVRLY